MKKLFAVLCLAVTVLLSFTACAANQSPRELVEDVSALETYSQFLSSLKSGRVTRYEYSFDSWYDLLTTYKTDLRFSTDEQGARSMLVRERYPLVFWDFPTPAYFDGKTYYYHHKGSWYETRGTSFAEREAPALMGFSAKLVEEYEILADNVYTRPDGGYDLYIQTQNEKAGTHNIITCKTNRDFQIENILVKTYTPTDSRKTDYRVRSCLIRYSDANKGKAVRPPASLEKDEIFQNKQA